MNQKNIYNPFVIGIVSSAIDKVPTQQSGTYNRADPTAYEKGVKNFTYKGAIFQLKKLDCTWGIELTISIRIPRFPKLGLSDLTEKEKQNDSYFIYRELGGFYLTKDTICKGFENGISKWKHVDYVIPRQNNKGLLKLLYLINKSEKPKEHLCPGCNHRMTTNTDLCDHCHYTDTWIDPAGGIHHGYDGDPASKYI